MGRLGFLLVVVLATAGAAYLTKPGAVDAEVALRAQVMQAVEMQELGEGQTAAQALALAACKLRPTDCYDLLRSGIEMQVTDRTLFTRVDMRGFERQAVCYGVFTRFVCPGGLKPL